MGAGSRPTASDDTAPTPVDSATSRTHLANERTYLAWWRTGIVAIATSVGVGRLVPSLTHKTRLPFAIVGAGFALLGVALIVYSLFRARDVHDAIDRGTYARPSDEVLVGLTLVGALLGLSLLVLVLVDI